MSHAEIIQLESKLAESGQVIAGIHPELFLAPQGGPVQLAVGYAEVTCKKIASRRMMVWLEREGDHFCLTERTTTGGPLPSFFLN